MICFTIHVNDELINYLNDKEYRLFREMVGHDFLDDEFIYDTNTEPELVVTDENKDEE